MCFASIERLQNSTSSSESHLHLSSFAMFLVVLKKPVELSVVFEIHRVNYRKLFQNEHSVGSRNVVMDRPYTNPYCFGDIRSLSRSCFTACFLKALSIILDGQVFSTFLENWCYVNQFPIGLVHYIADSGVTMYSFSSFILACISFGLINLFSSSSTISFKTISSVILMHNI